MNDACAYGAYINQQKAPFDKPEVREAISLVVDRTAMLGPTVFGHGTPTAVLFEDYGTTLPKVAAMCIHWPF